MQEPRRILHVVHGYFPESTGGTECYVQSLLAAQTGSGLEPLLLHGSFRPRPRACIEPRRDLDCPAFRLHRADTYADYWDKAHYPPAGRLFRQLLRTERPDLVHLHHWIRLTDDLVAIAEAEGVPTVVSLHDLYASCPACFRLRPGDVHCEREVTFENCGDCVPLRGVESAAEVNLGIELYRNNFRRELMRARCVLAATRATADLVTRGLGLDASLVDILPLGYARRFRQPVVAGPKAPPLRLAYWGNITHRKGAQVLLRALGALARTRSLAGRLEVHLFGRTDKQRLSEELHALAKGLPVVFHGRYDYEDLAEIGMHLAVFPSTCFETYGLVLDEAFELGVPAVATDVGAFAERLPDSDLLVPPGDVGALARKLDSILQDPSRLEEARRGIPPLSPDPAEHATLLLERYRRALRTSARTVEEVSPADRRRLAALREGAPRDGEPLRRGLP